MAGRRLRWLGLVCLLGGWAGAGAAAPAPSNTVITADALVFDYGRMIGTFEGNAVVVDPQVRMTCDKLVVMFEGTNAVKSVTASGNVRVQQADKRATAERAVYIAKNGEIELSGNARLYRVRDTVWGDCITFWLDKETVRCVPGHMSIEPTGERRDTEIVPSVLSRKKPAAK
jgi:lipopolysaccharide transport protein LptA